METTSPVSPQFVLVMNNPFRRVIGLTGFAASLYYTYVCLYQWEQAWAIVLPFTAIFFYMLMVAREKITVDETGIVYESRGLSGVLKTTTQEWDDIRRIETFPAWTRQMSGVRIFPPLAEPWEFIVGREHRERLYATLQTLAEKNRVPLEYISLKKTKAAEKAERKARNKPRNTPAGEMQFGAWVSVVAMAIFLLGYLWLHTLSSISLDKLTPVSGVLQDVKLHETHSSKSGYSRTLQFTITGNPHDFRLPAPRYCSEDFSATTRAIGDGVNVTVWVRPKFVKLKPFYALQVYQLEAQGSVLFPLAAYTGSFKWSKRVCLGAIGLFAGLLAYSLIRLVLIRSRRTRLDWETQ